MKQNQIQIAQGENATPPRPLPIKTYTTLVPTFAKKGVIFQRSARIREIKKKK